MRSLILLLIIPLLAHSKEPNFVLIGQENIKKTPSSELRESENFLYSGYFNSDEINNIRFFTTYAFPESYKYPNGEIVELRKNAESALNFVVNSCHSFRAVGGVERVKPVPKSDTLFWIDIRDYGWARKDIDSVFDLQPYYLKPLVSGRNPNILFRADWFIVNAMDTTKQEDRGLKNLVYFTLLYGLNNTPKDAKEFRELWGIKNKFARSGTIVNQGDSGVSRHTRMLRRVGSEGGYYWDTKDVKSHDIDGDTVKLKDFVEDQFGQFADAMEYILSHPTTHLQVYHLTAGNKDKFKTITNADAAIVIHRLDRFDPRVRTASACVNCHANGIIPYTNTIRELFLAGGKILTDNKDFYRRLKGFYLTFNNEEVEADNKIYASAIKKVNGLEPIENSKIFEDLYKWYWQVPVDLEQASLETGYSTDDILLALNDATTGRLVLFHKGKSMSREIWDSTLNGGYIQTMLLLISDGKNVLIQEKNEYLSFQEGYNEAKRLKKNLIVVKGLSREMAEWWHKEAIRTGHVFAVAKTTTKNLENGAHKIIVD